MKLNPIIFGTAVLLVVATSTSAQQLSNEWVISGRNLVALLKCVRPALRSSGGTARVYYSTVCRAQGPTLPFPAVQVQAPAQAKTGLPAVQEVFEKDKDVAVLQDQSGIIRIIIGKPDRTLLRTRIGSLQLTSDQQYTPELAILAFEQSKDIEAAMHNLKWDYPVTVSSAGVTEPAKGLPHLPRTLKNIMLDEAFDLIAKTFGGIVFYGTCQDKNGATLVTWRFAGPHGVGEENDIEHAKLKK